MTDSWWLKFKRAQQHMVDIRREARRYANAHPYRLAPIRQPKRYQNNPRYRVEVIQQPDPIIAVILGDFIHNLRSGLDHVVVAGTRPRGKRKYAGFPVSTENLWERDAQRRYIVRDAERRKSFRRAIEGLPPLAQTLVVASQPYVRPDRAAEGNILAILSRLENADKHRELITIGPGLRWPMITVTAPDGSIIHPPLNFRHDQFVPDGAEIQLGPAELFATNPEVQMQFTGTATISIKIAHGGRNELPTEFNLCQTMATALRNVRLLLRKMETFASRD